MEFGPVVQMSVKEKVYQRQRMDTRHTTDKDQSQ